MAPPKGRTYLPVCSAPLGPKKNLDWYNPLTLNSCCFFHSLILTFLLCSGPDRLVRYLGYGQVSVECERNNKEMVKGGENLHHGFSREETMNESVIQISELRELGTLEGLPTDRLDHLGRNMEELRVGKGRSIYRPGQPAKYLYCVLEGVIGISLLGSEDKFVRLTISTRGEFFGIDALMRRWRRLSIATALQDSRVGRIEPRVFVTEVCGLPWEPFSGLVDTLIKPVLKISLQRAMFLVENLSDRLALALWEIASGFDIGRSKGLLPATFTHDELAAMVGASRPRVSLALKRLERRGFLARSGKQIRVQEKPLRAYLEQRYGFVF